MMLSKDAARIIGKIGFLLPLLLILFIAADAAACPDKRSRAAFRTTAVKTRTAAYMPSTVITYRAPATYRLCGDNLYDTRRVRYVAARSNGHYNGSGARYVAVRRAPTRYLAVRNVVIDDDEPGYVAVRNVRRAPVYIEDPGTRYVAVRRAPVRYIAVRDIEIDDGDEPRYVAVRNVRRTPARYVAVRDEIDDDFDQPRYAAVRNAPAYVEEPDTKYVAVRDEFSVAGDDIVLRDTPTQVNHVVEYSDASFSNADGGAYLTTADTDDACLHPLASRTLPEAVSTRTVSYISADNDIDDYAFLKPNRTRYVAASELTRPESYIRVEEDDIEIDDDTNFVETSEDAGTVSYVPIDGISDLYDDDIQYVAVNDRAGNVNFVPINDAVTEVDDDDIQYVAASEFDEPCLRRVAVRTCPDMIDTSTVSYVPVDVDADFETVSYVPAESGLDYRAVSYVPADNLYSEPVDINDCPLEVSSVTTDPMYVSDTSTSLIEVRDAAYDADYSMTSRIARDYAMRDGFEDGRDAALERDAYHPENSGDYQKATNGYEDDFGDKGLYKESYRGAYLSGYRQGFDSIARSEERLG